MPEQLGRSPARNRGKELPQYAALGPRTGVTVHFAAPHGF
jgi:hypothetical protein